MSAYIPVLILMGVGAAIASIVLVITHVFGPKRPNILKTSVYECGVPPIGDARHRISVKYYLVAILFLLFDVEAIFFVPWALAYRKFLNVNIFILLEMVFFMAILLVGFVYVYRKGALEWD